MKLQEYESTFFQKSTFIAAKKYLPITVKGVATALFKQQPHPPIFQNDAPMYAFILLRSNTNSQCPSQRFPYR